MLYDTEKETIVSADASSYGLGAVIRQRQEDGTLKAVAYASRSMTKTECRYAQIEKEALVTTWALEHWSDMGAVVESGAVVYSSRIERLKVGRWHLMPPSHLSLILCSTTAAHQLTVTTVGIPQKLVVPTVPTSNESTAVVTHPLQSLLKKITYARSS